MNIADNSMEVVESILSQIIQTQKDKRGIYAQFLN